jgi:RNA polymerase sigma factor (sigma-70 family)
MAREIPVAQFFENTPLWGEPAEAGQPHSLQEVIEKILAEFDETDREILVMSLMGELSVRQIADMVGLSKSEVHRRLQVLVPELTAHLKENDAVTDYIGEG